ncbi:uncharacterized protein TNCV_4924971 [Trichonephila clavipes]|nr:uncharacterized protein TNCV_4924971 [Trichonephila clavipes]
MHPRQNKEKFQQLTKFERDKIICLREGGIFLSRNRSSCAVEQFHSDASLEALDRREPNNWKNWQWTTEGDVSPQRLIPASYGDG